MVLDYKVAVAWRDFVTTFADYVQYHRSIIYGASTFSIGGHPAATPDGVPLSASQLREELAREWEARQRKVQGLEAQLVIAQDHIHDVEVQLEQLHSMYQARTDPGEAGPLHRTPSPPVYQPSFSAEDDVDQYLATPLIDATFSPTKGSSWLQEALRRA